MQHKQTELMELCAKFIDDHNITCAECIYQRDDVCENMQQFIEQICEIVGYVDCDEDEDEDDA